MEGWQIAIVLKPFVLLALFGLIVIPLEILLSPYLPKVFSDRSFMSREPGKYMLVWLTLIVGLWTYIGLLIHRSG